MRVLLEIHGPRKTRLALDLRQMSERDWAEQAPGAAGQTAAPPAAAAAQPPPRPAHGLPSAHYPPIDPPIAAIVARGIASYPASVPRRGAARQLASRTLAPLEAPPLGPGRAAEVGELEDAETLYVGQVLAGKPHGRGRQYLKVRWGKVYVYGGDVAWGRPCAARAGASRRPALPGRHGRACTAGRRCAVCPARQACPAAPMTTTQAVPALNEFGYHLAYDGEWDRGRKCGVGTTSSLSGETYTGASCGLGGDRCLHPPAGPCGRPRGRSPLHTARPRRSQLPAGNK